MDRLQHAGLLPDVPLAVSQQPLGAPTSDSRAVEEGGTFVAVEGDTFDGHDFVQQSITAGAHIVLAERVPAGLAWGDGVSVIRVRDSRAALAVAAAVYFGDPSRTMKMVGITGTNGKTTTAFLVHHLLQTLVGKAGLVGTVATLIGNERQPSAMTTPDPVALQRLLRQMADAGCAACVMEVSSHALDQKRAAEIDFNVGVFTNLTQDHLDYHGTMEAYVAAKKKLFDGLDATATAVVNADDPSSEKMVHGTRAPVQRYGRTAGADVPFEVLKDRLDGLRLRLDGEERHFQLVGLFNAYNLAAAYGVGRALGIERGRLIEALAAASPVPGRFEQLAQDGVTAIVDYAHTPDALANVLSTIRETKAGEGAVWCVFGCGGDRDVSKRPLMGAVAERLADHLVITSDNPRSERPEAIIADIVGGLERPGAATIMPDRREAIRHAVALSEAGDVVLVAGKGHETYQIVGEERLHFDDREEVKRTFSSVIKKNMKSHAS